MAVGAGVGAGGWCVVMGAGVCWESVGCVCVCGGALGKGGFALPWVLCDGPVHPLLPMCPAAGLICGEDEHD